MVQQSQQAFNSFIGMIGQLYQLPHPQMPNQPLAADPNLDITGFLYRSLEFLRKELSYSGKYQPDDGDRRPNKLSDADRKRSQLGLPTRDERPVQLPGSTPGTSGATGSNGLPANGGPAGFGGPGSSSESLAGSVPGAQRKPEYAASLPGPGVVLGVSDADTVQASTQASWGSPAQNQWASQAQQTYAPQASTQGYSAQELSQIQQLVSQQQQAAQAQYLSQSASEASDSYLSQISDVSLEVLEHFGLKLLHCLTTTHVQ
jgi:hypothetical protein